MSADINLLPEFARKHRLATISKKDADGDYTNETVTEEELDNAEVVTSESRFYNGNEMHRPILDIDMPVTVIPSSTPGHGHLYIDKKLTWEDYSKLLNVLAEVGIIEEGYAAASIARQHTAVRLPWVKKKLVEEL